ncbi:MAG: type II toxin-antitoxin system VapC family toxin [Lentisphaerae bacterium]|jgi:predicted nucleic acid-binding protein|nr:type II toxin-antitoxin system VapC family toxin [Lentisphaerota bacterium]
MSRYVLDTNIVLGLLKGAPYARYVLDAYQPFSAPNISIQSIVTLAELEAMGFRRQWGTPRLEKLNQLLRKIPLQDINHPAIIRQYVEIDAYRHNGHPDQKLPQGQSAFSMGDNDIWIAATAAALKASLLTTDKDFLPLHGVFLDVVWIDQQGMQ